MKGVVALRMGYFDVMAGDNSQPGSAVESTLRFLGDVTGGVVMGIRGGGFEAYARDGYEFVG